MVCALVLVHTVWGYLVLENVRDKSKIIMKKLKRRLTKKKKKKIDKERTNERNSKTTEILDGRHVRDRY